MKILMLDNYDSFTFNLVHILEQDPRVKLDIFRNDKISLEDIKKYDKIILSPGPGIPSEAGIMIDLIKEYAPSKSILGVCLGHQGIVEAFGGSLINLEHVMHGVSTPTFIINIHEKLFRNMRSPFSAGRYHSWVVDKKTLPADFTITSTDMDEQIMSVSHKKYDLKGLQFHPESVLTENGKLIIDNWINE